MEPLRFKYKEVSDQGVLYESILTRTPHAAGLRYSRARLYLGRQPARAAVEAHAALKDCSNYTAAGEVAVWALAAPGKKAEAEAFRKS